MSQAGSTSDRSATTSPQHQLDPMRTRRFREALTSPYSFALGGILIAVGLTVIAQQRYEQSAPDSFDRSLAQILLQLAVIVVIGALVKFLSDLLVMQRSMLEQDRNKRLDFLRRLRDAHVHIVYAQRLIRAHLSGRTYTQQLQSIMLVTPQLEEISEDLKATKGLFGRDDQIIIYSIEELINYLKSGADEYVRCHRYVDEDAQAKHGLEKTMRERKMAWLEQFMNQGTDYCDNYDTPLTNSKGRMRGHVFGPREVATNR